MDEGVDLVGLSDWGGDKVSRGSLSRLGADPSPPDPLLAIDWAKVAIIVGPLVPDGDTVLIQPLDVGVALEKPQQLVDDGFCEDLLGGQEWEAVGHVHPDLRAEDTDGANAGSVRTGVSMVKNVLQQVKVWFHFVDTLARQVARAL